MPKITLLAKKREDLGKKVRNLRKKGLIPAILYGHKIKNIPLSVSADKFSEIYGKVGESTILTLAFDGEKRNVLIKDVDLDPVTGNFRHIDFYQTEMTKKITANVPLKFTGVSQAVKEKGGVLVKNIDEIKVECLPADLPSEIKVDLSLLKKIDDVVCIKDLDISSKVKILAKKEDVVVVVTPPRTEEELKELEEKPEEKVEEIEGVVKEEPEEEAIETEAAAKPEKKEKRKAQEEK